MSAKGRKSGFGAEETIFPIVLVVLAFASLAELYFYDLLGLPVVENIPLSAAVTIAMIITIVLSMLEAERLWG